MGRAWGITDRGGRGARGLFKGDESIVPLDPQLIKCKFDGSAIDSIPMEEPVNGFLAEVKEFGHASAGQLSLTAVFAP